MPEVLSTRRMSPSRNRPSNGGSRAAPAGGDGTATEIVAGWWLGAAGDAEPDGQLVTCPPAFSPQHQLGPRNRYQSCRSQIVIPAFAIATAQAMKWLQSSEC